MKRRTILAALLAAVLLTAGCGSAGGNSGSTSAGGSEWGMSDNATAEVGESLPAAQEEGTDSLVYQNAGAKLIRRAELDIETEHFDQAAAALAQLTQECGGYFEQASVFGGGYLDANARRSGSYIVRVPAERYQDFLSGAGGLGYLTRCTESSEDVGEQYYDTEARLRTQRTKQERLLALLEQAEAMEDIISLENALSEVEYQIEQYTTTLNRYDALISFSTFTIYLEEVSAVSQEVGTSASLGTRLAAGLASSAGGLLDGAREGLVWLSYHLFQILIPLAAAAVGMLCWWRFHRKKAGGGGEKDDPS